MLPSTITAVMQLQPLRRLKSTCEARGLVKRSCPRRVGFDSRWCLCIYTTAAARRGAYPRGCHMAAAAAAAPRTRRCCRCRCCLRAAEPAASGSSGMQQLHTRAWTGSSCVWPAQGPFGIFSKCGLGTGRLWAVQGLVAQSVCLLPWYVSE